MCPAQKCGVVRNGCITTETIEDAEVREAREPAEVVIAEATASFTTAATRGQLADRLAAPTRNDTQERREHQ